MVLIAVHSDRDISLTGFSIMSTKDLELKRIEGTLTPETDSQDQYFEEQSETSAQLLVSHPEIINI